MSEFSLYCEECALNRFRVYEVPTGQEGVFKNEPAEVNECPKDKPDCKKHLVRIND